MRGDDGITIHNDMGHKMLMVEKPPVPMHGHSLTITPSYFNGFIL